MDVSSETLSIHWAFGFTKDVTGSVQNLTTADRNAIFFLSSHSGVIYDYENRSQLILQGHTHVITCCAVSKDKRWIVTADIGDESILVVWDSMTGAPVKTYFNPHPQGVCAVDISSDSMFVTSVGAPVDGEVQEIAVWAWTTESDSPLLSANCLTSDTVMNVVFDTSNNFEIATTGGKNVTFWNWSEYNIEGYVGKATKGDLGFFSGNFTQSIFLPETGDVISVTDGGYAISWGTQFSKVLLGDNNEATTRTASKVVKLVECGISLITVVNGYIAIGCSSGSVRFYDFSLRLEAWFDDFAAGPIASLSFCVQVCPYPEGEGGAPGLQFWVPDFMVGTTDAFIVGVESHSFGEVRPEDRRGTLLMQGFSDEVTGVACHPQRALLALACLNGSLQVWDYEMKLLLNLREFNFADAAANDATVRRNKPQFLRPTSFEYHPAGTFLAVGFSSGHIKFLHCDTLADIASYNNTHDSIVGLKLNNNGEFMVAWDTSNRVLLYRREGAEEGEPSSNPLAYTFVGRAIAHSQSIVGVSFGVKDTGPVLISVGADRRVCEFSLKNSSVETGLELVEDPSRLELVARPTALAWSPRIGDDVEDRFFIANDDFKFKEYNAESKQCRRTTMAPVFGGAPTQILPFPLQEGSDTAYYAYSTAKKVVGMGVMPLTGNPRSVMGLVAHPDRVTGMAISNCGRYMFTTGGSDLSANMWNIDVSKLPTSYDLQDNTSAFLEILEGGAGGSLHNDIIDHFYYCQLRTQGEDAMEERATSGRVSVEELPNMVRAIGFYPSEEEIANMVQEVRYKHFMQDGILEEDIALNEFITLYVNHRPIVPLTSASIDAAVETVAGALNKDTTEGLPFSVLKNVLTTEGEPFSEKELTGCLNALIGPARSKEIGDNDEAFTSAKIADEILGFEDFQTE